MAFDSPFGFFFTYFWYGLVFQIGVYFILKPFVCLGMIRRGLGFNR